MPPPENPAILQSVFATDPHTVHTPHESVVLQSAIRAAPTPAEMLLILVIITLIILTAILNLKIDPF